MLTSARRGISYPNPDRSDRPDVPAHILNLVNALELDVVYAQGTDASRLAATHMAGKVWWTTDTKLLWYDDGTSWWQIGVGQQLDFAQITATVTLPASGTQGTSTTIITGNSITYDGSRIQIEFYAPAITGSGAITGIEVRKDGNAIGNMIMGSGSAQIGVFGKLFDTPSAGAHTYSIRGWNANGSNAMTVQAGAGGANTTAPAFMRIVRV